jgi:hypothetical protein
VNTTSVEMSEVSHQSLLDLVRDARANGSAIVEVTIPAACVDGFAHSVLQMNEFIRSGYSTTGGVVFAKFSRRIDAVEGNAVSLSSVDTTQGETVAIQEALANSRRYAADVARRYGNAPETDNG